MYRPDLGPGDSGLLTDLYQLTMLDAYVDGGMHDEAVFEFFSRRLPQSRNFLLAAGLEQLLDFLERLRFTDEDIRYLESTQRFKPGLIDYLADEFKKTLRIHSHASRLPEYAETLKELKVRIAAIEKKIEGS